MNTERGVLRRLPPSAVILFLAVAVFIEIASVVQAIRQESWGPMYATGWLPAVVAASYTSTDVAGCWRRRRRRAQH
jgi:hypothetical protein